MGSYLVSLERIVRQFRVRQCPVPFVILTMERTGSSYLCSLLNSHPDIICRREDFHEVIVQQESELPKNTRATRVTAEGHYFRQISQFGKSQTTAPTNKQSVAHLYDIFSCPHQACGFKFKYPLQHDLFPEIIDELHSIGKKLRIISLTRRNFIKQAVSRQNMLRIRTVTEGNECNLSSRVSQSSKQAISETSFRIDVAKAIKYATQLQRQHLQFHNKLREFSEVCGREVFEIDYQDLLDRKAETINSALGYLEVSQDVELTSNIAKATSDQLSQAVENYDELVDAVQGTEFEAYLDR